MQQFAAYATIFFQLSYMNFLSRLAYATISSLCNNFLAFLSQIFLDTCLCNNFLTFISEFFLRLAYATFSSLCNNL